jgi:glycogen debranching enzyme
MLHIKLIQEAHLKATNILHECATSYGYRASGLAAGYPQVWARDSAITFLGAVCSGDQTLIRSGRAALETLGKHQTGRGLIPLNVNPDTGYVSTENAGAVDSNLWFILGHYLYFQYTHDLASCNSTGLRSTRRCAGSTIRT